MHALLVVDIQNDFLPNGRLPVPRGDEVVPVANAVMTRFELVVATQDWHPPDHGSFASQHAGKQPGDVIKLNGLEQVLWPDHCIQETPGANFVPGLDTDRFTRVFRKGADSVVDSYSGFFDNGRRHDTGLAEYLREQGVDTVYVLGLALEVCVRATALDACGEGFRTYVIEDGCRAVDLEPGDGARALEELRQAGVTVTTSDAVPLT
jgi:nicotinamidase/pyrazinamidase